MGRRRGPAHPHAAERLVAPVPPGEQLAAPAPRDARPDRGAGWEAVCFNAPVVETYRLPDATRHPGLGGLGPDLRRADADLGRCVELLLAYDDPQATVAEVLLDQRVFCGVGNVYRCEVLWAGELSLFAQSATCPRRTPCASSTSPPSSCAPTSSSRAHHRPRRAGRPRRVRAQRAALPSLRRQRSRGRPTGATPAPCTGARTARSARPRAGRARRHVPIDRHPAATKFLDDLGAWRRSG